MQPAARPAPGSPELVPVENPVFRNLAIAISTTISRHQPVRRGDGLVGNTCRFPLCRERIFLNRAAGSDHQAFEVIRTIRTEVGYALTDGDEPELDAEYRQNIIAIFGLDAGEEQEEGVGGPTPS